MSRHRAMVALVVVFAALLAPVAGAATAGDLVNQVSQAQYRYFLDNVLYTRLGHNRGTQGAQHDPCRDAIRNYLTSLGLQTRLDPYPAAWYGPAGSNVIGTKIGKTRPNDIIIVGAHYDSVNNPGADDNASGVAAMLEIARVAAGHEFEATIVFIAYDGEEFGRCGSRWHSSQHYNENIVAMISIEMISYNNGSNRAYIGKPDAYAFPGRLANAITQYGQGLTPVTTNQIVDTDNWSYFYYGLPNCYITEEWPNPNYHLASDSVDTPNYIDYTYATRITRSLVGWLAGEAGLVASTATPDTVAPAAITNLAATAATTGAAVNLTWSAPADYGANGSGPFPVASYDLRYSTVSLSEANWATATKAAGLAAPKAPGSAEAFTVTGLASGTRYYFAIKSTDAAGNVSALSNVASAVTGAPDTVAPNAVLNLAATAGTTGASVNLAWSAPADYGSGGTGPFAASSYDLRYGTVSLSEANWGAATKVTGLAKPKAPGSAEAFAVTGLAGGTTYYFAIKSADAAGNVSAISNVTSARTSSVVQKVLQPGLSGYAGVKDAYLVSGTTYNYGSASQMLVSGSNSNASGKVRRSIVRFDVSSIPAGATVTSATLSLYSYDSATVRGKTGFYGVYPVSQDWTETQVNWFAAKTGVSWTTAGGSFGGADATSAKQSRAGVWYSWDVTSRVRSWLAGTSVNYGWVVKCADEGTNNQDYFYQSTFTNITLRPKLTITYTGP